jgi:glycosyltransferase involved in cell wall biosynthesis
MSFGKSKNLIIHDYFENFGGGERLIKVLYNTGIFDLVYGFEKNNLIKKLNLNKKSLSLDQSKKSILHKKILLKKNFENLDIKKKYNCYLMSGNYSIFTKIPTHSRKIFYCHSLPKIFFEFEKFYKNTDIIKKFINFFFKEKFVKEYIKRLKKFDEILCNSIYTQKKIKKFCELNAKVIYPPIQTFTFKWISQKNYFISNSRHEIGKNLEIIINVFKKKPELKIYFTSYGSQTNYLKSISKGFKNIIFKDFLSEKDYNILLGNSCATINISSKEDFGMAALEGLSAGKPAIVLNEGGYLETIKHNFNGFIINKNDLENQLSRLLSTLKLDKLYQMKGNCIRSVKKFNEKRFLININKFIK